MGGNALKNTITKRLNANEYFLLENEVVKKLESILPNTKIAAIPAYRTKADFGDMDVLINSEELPQNWKTLVSSIFQSNESISNGDVFSTDYKQFQIDLIVIQNKYFDIAHSYFSFNDLGNLIGRIAHKMGFKYGHKGLLYPFRDGDYLFKEIEVSTELSKILPFLGYDYQKFTNGFNGPIDIFNYTSSSPFFNPSTYLLDNRNYKAKVRDSKRKTYMGFLKWIEGQEDLNNFQFPVSKQDWLGRAYEHFPTFQTKYSSTHKEFIENKIIKTKFNGTIIQELTNLSGKPLSIFMNQFKEQFKDPSIARQWIIDSTESDINSAIQNFFEKTENIANKIKQTFKT